jgi:hypothetical protein
MKKIAASIDFSRVIHKLQYGDDVASHRTNDQSNQLKNSLKL